MSKTIREIKEELERASGDERRALYALYEQDKRTGVQKLLISYRKQELAKEQELLRLEGMCTYEKKYRSYDRICGIDEVGRGPLAGPVVAAAVILPKDCRILYASVGVGMASPQRIDEINILQATYEAMREAIRKLSPSPDLLLNDAVTIPGVPVPQVPIIKGDAKSLSIACASIIAKVTRDRLMEEYDRILPEYGFASHKGYGSREHMEAIQAYGPSPIHRQSFLRHFV